MTIKEILQKAFFDGFATSDIEINTVFICLICTMLLSVYIYMLYKNINKNSFYNKNFNLSLIVIAIITAAIIMTIQSNIVVSLGMVGALSIVRFRTAIKDPMDLGFLFWSISIGIICGAGFVMIAVIATIVLTIVVVIFVMLPETKSSIILVINAKSHKNEAGIMEIVNEECSYVKIRARNASKEGMNLAIEVNAKNQTELLDKLMDLDFILSASLVEHDGDVTV